MHMLKKNKELENLLNRMASSGWGPLEPHPLELGLAIFKDNKRFSYVSISVCQILLSFRGPHFGAMGPSYSGGV
jgi:hypothetical protein